MSSLTMEIVDELCESLRRDKTIAPHWIDKLREAALRALPAGEGVVVPREPTEEWIRAVEDSDLAQRVFSGYRTGGWTEYAVVKHLHAAMLAASPAPVAAEIRKWPEFEIRWIRFDSDCVVNGIEVKAGTSWGPFAKDGSHAAQPPEANESPVDKGTAK